MEVALDVNELEALAEKRRSVRNRLEKAIAIMHATSRRPKIWIGKGFYKDTPNDKPEEVDETWFSKCLGYEILDEIEHQTLLLNTLNNAIESLQKVYYDQRQKLSELEGLRLVQLQKKLTTKASGVVDYVKEKVGMTIEPDEMTDNSLNKTLIDYDNLGTISVKQSAESPLRNSLEGTIEDKNRDAAISTDSKSSSAITMARKVKGAVLIGVEELAKEGLKTTEVATRGYEFSL